MVEEVSPEELKAEIDAGRPPVMLDVREPWELDISRLAGIVHIPMGEIPDRLGELDPAQPVTVICRSGGRSLRVAQFLEQNGFARVSNLTGGMLAWGERIDPSQRPY
ncbi:MAG: rhodanese-like domain-containing protein [Steroidobacteraceae bacterium]|jgi:rhodanese-related sulfurtransferase|nr:rhodanese-like domain-containing protein [Steroidobacteraceae bacterium]